MISREGYAMRTLAQHSLVKGLDGFAGIIVNINRYQ